MISQARALPLLVAAAMLVSFLYLSPASEPPADSTGAIRGQASRDASAGAPTEPRALPLCAHRGSTAPSPSPMTAAALSANVAALFAARVFCFDVDVTADPDGGPPILGHPADVGRAQSTAALPRLADLLHSPLLRGDGPPVLFLVEPKAGPEKRPELVKRILEIAETASALSQRARAIYLISSNAADAASDAAAGARVAFPLLDRTKCPVPPEALRAASLLMPSVRCMEGASRQAVDRWRGTHAGAEIVSWLADDCRSLRAALADGATRVVSNVADDLARNCTF